MVSQCFFTDIFYIFTATNKLNNRHKSTSKTKQTDIIARYRCINIK